MLYPTELRVRCRERSSGFPGGSQNAMVGKSAGARSVGDPSILCTGGAGGGLVFYFPMENLPPAHQAYEDAEQLKLLSVFHYVLAGLLVVGGCLMAAYFAFASYMVTEIFKAMPPSAGPPPPSGVGWYIGAMGAGITLAAVTFAALHFMCARWLGARRNRSFCFVVACLTCILIPFGTILGIFTILVLQRSSVQALFDRSTPGAYLNR
jgi:hypothetical protein